QLLGLPQADRRAVHRGDAVTLAGQKHRVAPLALGQAQHPAHGNRPKAFSQNLIGLGAIGLVIGGAASIRPAALLAVVISTGMVAQPDRPSAGQDWCWRCSTICSLKISTGAPCSRPRAKAWLSHSLASLALPLSQSASAIVARL